MVLGDQWLGLVAPALQVEDPGSFQLEEVFMGSRRGERSPGPSSATPARGLGGCLVGRPCCEWAGPDVSGQGLSWLGGL